ncbi:MULTISPECIES: phage integrase [Methylotenera]|uniref:phage integrase n=1 Tax=Methylotenera TaxID=359407 RepID=UPI0003716A14|nr:MULTISPECIES: DUF6538 domain-containing protein [Methylotenera]
MTLPIQTHLITRNGTYYFRRRIPLELLAYYSPKLEIIFSLKTKDLREAERLSRAEDVRLDIEFEGYRNNTTIKSIDSISKEDIKNLTDAWKAHILEEDEEARTDGLSERDFRKINESLEIVDIGGKAALARGDTSTIKFEMLDFCESHGYHILEDSIDYNKLAYAFLRASVEANSQLMLRHQGEIVETPEAPIINPVSKSTSKFDTLEGLRDYWISQATTPLSRTAIAEANTMIKKVREMLGDIKPNEFTKSHVISLKDKMLEAKSSPATINKGRGILAAIFSTAEKNLKIQHNPFKDMTKLSIPEREVDNPYTVAELQSIFNSKVFTQGYRPKRFKGEAAFWMPLIGLYTAARLNEIGQLYINDIGEDEGINYILIRPELTTGRTVKDGKKRRAPIHPDLIKMGFLDYVQAKRECKEIQLFPELKVTRVQGKLADKWGEWWSSYVRKELGITRVPMPFHGLRHAFSDHSRRSKMAYDCQMRIEGHSMGNVGDKYGARLFPLDALNEEMQKLNFKGLDLSHLKR